MPNQTATETKQLAEVLKWRIEQEKILTVMVDSYLVYANFGDQPAPYSAAYGSNLPSWAAGWLEIENY